MILHVSMSLSGSWCRLYASGMMYITFPTELGTLYTADELRELADVCRQYGLLLYVDGARLAYGLAASPDVTLPLLSSVADIFYIGGTKCGALCGEAVVFPRGNAPSHMLSRIKRHGSLVDGLGYSPFIDSPTNQQFYIIPNKDLPRLRQHIGFEVWCPVDASHTACRFVTSWATTEEEIAELEKRCDF